MVTIHGMAVGPGGAAVEVATAELSAVEAQLAAAMGPAAYRPPRPTLWMASARLPTSRQA